MKERVTIGLLERRQHSVLAPTRWLGALREDLAAIWSYRYVLRNLVGAKLRVRYQRSVLGLIWALLTPILMLIVLSVVFGHILDRKIERFPVYLFTGLVPFKFFSGGIAVGCKSIVSGQRIITRFSVPPMLVALADLLFGAVNMMFEMLALVVVLAVVGSKISGSLIVLPVAVVLLVMFTTGMVFIAMTLVTYFRDLEHVVSVVMRAMYFATPVILQPRLLGKYSIVMWSNPLTYLLGFFRCALYDGSWPTQQAWLVASGSAVAALVVGYTVYKRYEHDYVFRI